MNKQKFNKEIQKSCIKGLLFEIARDGLDIEKIALEVIQMGEKVKKVNFSFLQKAVLGKITEYLKSDVEKSQAVAVSVKITQILS